jgi:membrane-anchored protein YejM (alkaline phosphatase superfamily)
MNGYEILFLEFFVLPMLLLGLAGWFIGKKLESKYPKRRWLRWVGLAIGLLLGPVIGTPLSFMVAPCGFFGC